MDSNGGSHGFLSSECRRSDLVDTIEFAGEFLAVGKADGEGDFLDSFGAPETPANFQGADLNQPLLERDAIIPLELPSQGFATDAET